MSKLYYKICVAYSPRFQDARRAHLSVLILKSFCLWTPRPRFLAILENTLSQLASLLSLHNVQEIIAYYLYYGIRCNEIASNGLLFKISQFTIPDPHPPVEALRLGQKQLLASPSQRILFCTVLDPVWACLESIIPIDHFDGETQKK